MLVLKDKLFFIVRKLRAWHWEHFRAFELQVSPNKDILLLGPDELTSISIGGLYCRRNAFDYLKEIYSSLRSALT